MDSTGGYEIVPVVRTPSVKAGDIVKIDVYCTGAGIPSENRLTVDCAAGLVSPVTPGEGQVPNLWVAAHGAASQETATERVEMLADGGADWDAEVKPSTESGRVSESVSLHSVSFDRNPQPDETEYAPTYRVSETPHAHAPPAQVEIRTNERATPGRYNIPVTFSYPADAGVETVTETVSVKVGSLAQRLRSRSKAAAFALGSGVLGVATAFF